VSSGRWSVKEILGGLLLLVVIPALVNEMGELAPSLAQRLLRWGARRLGPEFADRYEEQWLAELAEVQGKLTKLVWAIGIVLYGVPRMRWQFHSRRRKVERALARSKKSSSSPPDPRIKLVLDFLGEVLASSGKTRRLVMLLLVLALAIAAAIGTLIWIIFASDLRLLITMVGAMVTTTSVATAVKRRRYGRRERE
jgi:hypothetical protein